MFTKFLYDHTKFPSKKMKVKGKSFEMFLADSFVKKTIGLMYRPSLKPNQGMLFDFGFQRRWKIWMLNMKFNIDVIWLDESKKVVDIKKDLPPSKSVFFSKVYAPKSAAKYVLEIKANQSSALKIKIGEKLW